MLSRIFIWGTGDSGVFGFDSGGGSLCNRFFRYYKHSSFFTQTNIEQYWCPFLFSGEILPSPRPVAEPHLVASFLIKFRWVLRILVVCALLIFLPYFSKGLLRLPEDIFTLAPSYNAGALNEDLGAAIPLQNVLRYRFEERQRYVITDNGNQIELFCQRVWVAGKTVYMEISELPPTSKPYKLELTLRKSAELNFGTIAYIITVDDIADAKAGPDIAFMSIRHK